MGRYEGSIRLELKTKRVRALLGNSRLDIRASSYDYHDYFQEHDQRLADLGSTVSESAHVDWFVDLFKKPD